MAVKTVSTLQVFLFMMAFNIGQQDGNILFPKEGEERCLTISRQVGTCIVVTRCDVLLGQRNFTLLQKSGCGFDGEIPKVCCPIATPPTPVAETNTGLNFRPSANASSFTLHRKSSSENNTARNIGSVGPRLFGVINGEEAKNGRNKQVLRLNEELFPTECGRNNVTISRVVGGQNSIRGAWPWMAVIFIVRSGFRNAECGGALITSKHVITAAHCIVERNGKPVSTSSLIVRLGEYDLESTDDGANPVDFRVKSVLLHEEFHLRTFKNDIAILELSNVVIFTTGVGPLCLPFDVFQNENLAGKNAFVAGWGTISYNGESSNILQEIQIRIWENSECRKMFQTEAFIRETNICAGDGLKDSCKGDSGGPLMLPHRNGKFYLVGIVSFGKKCAEPGYPGVYTRVTSFLDWISSKIN